MPGQLGPMRRHTRPSNARFTRTMSFTGMPSVMQMINQMPASAASRMASAAADAFGLSHWDGASSARTGVKAMGPDKVVATVV